MFSFDVIKVCYVKNQREIKMRKAQLFLTVLSLFMIGILPSQDIPSVTGVEVTTDTQLLESPDFYKQNPYPITLKQVINKTLANNLDIRISDYDRRIAEYEIEAQKGIYDLEFESKINATNIEDPQPSKNSALTNSTSQNINYGGEASLSQLLPTGAVVGFTYELDKTKTNSAFVDYSTYYTQDASVFLQQPLLKNFGRDVTESGIDIARNNNEISQEAYLLEAQNQIASVSKAYWSLVYAIKNYEVQRLSLKQARDFLRITRVSYETGVLPRTDVLQAEAQVAMREENVIIAESVIKSSEDNLKLFMNIPRASKDWDRYYLPIDEPDVKQIAVDQNRFLEDAFENRPDYRQAELSIDNKTIQKKVAANQKMPELNLSAYAGRSGLGVSHDDAWDELNTYDYHSYDFSLEFKFPLQNRKGKYNYKQAALEEEKAEISLRDLENRIIFEVRNAIRQLRTEKKRIQATSVSVEAQKAKLDAELQRYRVGKSTSYNVLEFQQDYAEALSHLIQSKVNFNKALIDLYKSRGIILSSFNINDSGEFE